MLPGPPTRRLVPCAKGRPRPSSPRLILDGEASALWGGLKLPGPGKWRFVGTGDFRRGLPRVPIRKVASARGGKAEASSLRGSSSRLGCGLARCEAPSSTFDGDKVSENSLRGCLTAALGEGCTRASIVGDKLRGGGDACAGCCLVGDEVGTSSLSWTTASEATRGTSVLATRTDSRRRKADASASISADDRRSRWAMLLHQARRVPTVEGLARPVSISMGTLRGHSLT